MKIKYEFADGTVSEVEVSAEIGSVIVESRKAEHAGDERERYHREFSLDGAEFEGAVWADPTEPGQMMIDAENSRKIYEALAHLSDTQRRRLLMLAEGLTMREIARREGVEKKTLCESIDGARKNFLKYF